MNTHNNVKNIFNELAQHYHEKVTKTCNFHDTFDIFCSYINTKNPTIFEIGCGPGNITAYFTKKYPDFKITAIDFSETMLALAKVNNPKTEFMLMDCRNINLIKTQYNGIICGFCLPYLSTIDVDNLITNSYLLLKNKGILYLSTMEDDYKKSRLVKTSISKPIYTHFYTLKDLSKRLKNNGFKIIKVIRKNVSQNYDCNTNDLVIIAQKQKLI